MEKLLGYTVENLHQPEGGKAAYKLHGPRATYTLMRQMNDTTLMFALNSRYNICDVKGNYAFTDRTGELDTALTR